MNNVYVIYGEDLYKINKEINKIVNNKDDITKYDMTSSNIKEAILDASMISFFNDNKIIICENSFFLTSVKTDVNHDIDELIKYIKNPNSSTTLIITVNEPKLDDRKKVVKELKQSTKMIECSKATYNDLIGLIKEEMKKNEYKILEADMKYLALRIGNSLSILDNELNKLMLYKYDEKEITKEDIDLLVNKQVDDNIFGLMDKLLKNDKEAVFETYKELIDNGEEPVKILVMLANQYRLIFYVKELMQKGYKEFEMAKELGVHSYPIKLAKEKASNFTMNQLKDYLLKLSILDNQIKTGEVNKYLGIEMFFLEI